MGAIKLAKEDIEVFEKESALLSRAFKERL
jgi:hypothetical protein